MKKIIASLFGKKSKRFFTKKDIETLIEQVQKKAVEEYKQNNLLIDQLEEAIKAAGIKKYDRDGWHEDIPFPDDCEWLDIHLPWKKDKRYTLHFYFVNNSTTLDHVGVFESTREYVVDGGNILAETEGRDARWAKEQEEKKQQENTTKEQPKAGWATVTISSSGPTVYSVKS